MSNNEITAITYIVSGAFILAIGAIITAIKLYFDSKKYKKDAATNTQHYEILTRQNEDLVAECRASRELQEKQAVEFKFYQEKRDVEFKSEMTKQRELFMEQLEKFNIIQIGLKHEQGVMNTKIKNIDNKVDKMETKLDKIMEKI